MRTAPPWERESSFCCSSSFRSRRTVAGEASRDSVSSRDRDGAVARPGGRGSRRAARRASLAASDSTRSRTTARSRCGGRSGSSPRRSARASARRWIRTSSASGSRLAETTVAPVRLDLAGEPVRRLVEQPHQRPRARGGDRAVAVLHRRVGLGPQARGLPQGERRGVGQTDPPLAARGPPRARSRRGRRDAGSDSAASGVVEQSGGREPEGGARKADDRGHEARLDHRAVVGEAQVDDHVAARGDRARRIADEGDASACRDGRARAPAGSRWSPRSGRWRRRGRSRERASPPRRRRRPSPLPRRARGAPRAPSPRARSCRSRPPPPARRPGAGRTSRTRGRSPVTTPGADRGSHPRLPTRDREPNRFAIFMQAF